MAVKPSRFPIEAGEYVMSLPSLRLTSILATAAALAAIAPPLHAAPPKYRLTRVDPPAGWIIRSPGVITRSGDVFGLLYSVERDIQHVYSYENGVLSDLTAGRGEAVFRRSTLNELGHMVVTMDDGSFLYADGQFTPLVLPGQAFVAWSMNDHDQIAVATPQTPDSPSAAYVYDAGTFSLVPTGPFVSLTPQAINNAGAITGAGGFDPSGGNVPTESQVFRYRNGTTLNLVTFGGSLAVGNALNEKGMVTGYAETESGLRHAFRYAAGTLKDLGTLGGPESLGWEINEAGHVVGRAQLSSGAWRAFVYKNGTMKNLGAPGGGASSDATYITRNGQVAGRVLDESGRRQGVFVYGVDGERTHELNELIDDSDPEKPFVRLLDAIGKSVNELGQISALGSDSRGGVFQYLVSPVDSTKPLIAPLVRGILGANGWYTGDVALSWSVRDPQAPIASRSGCADASVTRDTGGKQFTCKATSIGGTRTKSVVIRRDTRRPSVALSAPADGAVFTRNRVVRASYSCEDATSGVANCTGTVPSGDLIDTSRRLDDATFTVKARDRAGKTQIVTHHYSVD